MTLTGTLEEILPEKQITEKFTVKEFALKMDDNGYEQHILLQLSNKNIPLIDSFMEGEEVTVHFTIGGRKHKDRYYNSLKVFKIEAHGQQSAPLEPQRVRKEREKEEKKNIGGNPNEDFPTVEKTATEKWGEKQNEHDDLPF